MRQRLAFEYLSNELAEGHMRQIAFHRFKDAVRQSRIDKLIRKYRGFRYWRNAKRKRDQIRKAALIALKVEKAADERATRRVFHALQQNRVETQLGKLTDVLQSTVDKHKELDNTLAATRAQHEATNKTLALQRLASHLANKVFPYFSKWRRHCVYYRKGLNKLRVLTYTLYRNKLGSAMDQWKANAKRVALGKMEVSIAESGEKIQALENEKLDKENAKAGNEANVKDKIAEKLAKNLIVVDHIYMRISLRQWNQNAKKVKDADVKLEKLCKRLSNIKQWLALNHLKAQIKEQSTAELWEQRVRYLTDKSIENNLKRKLAKWKKYTERIKRAKAQTYKAIQGFEQAQSKWAMQEWIRVVREHRIAEKEAEAEHLRAQEKELTRTNEELLDQNVKLDRQKQNYQEHIKQKAVLILWNNAVRQKKLDRESAFYRWKVTAMFKKKKQKRAHKVLKELVLSNERKAFDKWLSIIRNKHAQEKLQHLEEQKAKMKIGKTRSRLEETQKVSEKAEAEKLLERAKKSAAKTHEIASRVLGQLIRKRDLNFYQPLGDAVLKQWKQVSEREKNLSARLMGLAKRHMLEHTFIKLKNATVEKSEVHKKHKAFETMMRLSGKSQIKDAVNKWRNYIYHHEHQTFRENMDTKLQQIQGVEGEIEQLNDKLYVNGEDIISRRKKEKILHNLANATFYSRFLKDKAAAFGKNRKYMRVKSAVQKWRNRAMEAERLRLKGEKADRFAREKLSRKTLALYRRAVKSIRALPKVLNSLSNKMYMHDKIRGALILKSYTESHAEHLRTIKSNGAARLGLISERILRGRILTYIGIIGANAKIVRTRTDKLVRAVAGPYLKNLREAFRALNETKDKRALEESVESEGKRAQELRQLQEEVSLMEDTLIKEGYQPEVLEKEVKKMAEEKEQLIKKAVARWLAYQDKKDEVVQTVDKWKKFSDEKHVANERMNRLLNFLAKRPIHKGFSRWRNYNRKMKEMFKGYTKDELIDEAMNRGKMKAALTDEVTAKGEHLAGVETVCNKLQEKYELSKYFALLLTKMQNNDTLAKALQRWRQNIHKNKSSTLRQKLDELSQKMKDIMTTNDDLEEKNIALAAENEELRQLSLESVDLAASMKDMNRQKERLSVDLADRSVTIRKLLEDNKILKEKLMLAQKEAESGFGILAKRRYVTEKEQ